MHSDRKTATITIMRHAQSIWNGKRLQGLTIDPPIVLSEQGRADVKARLSSIPLPNFLITSPLIRCIQTAETWFGLDYDKINCPKIMMESLTELNPGDLTGLTMCELDDHPKYGDVWRFWRKDPAHFTGFPNGENLVEFQKRILNAVSEICRDYGDKEDLNICIITHGAALRIIKCFLTDTDLSEFWNAEKPINLDRIELTQEHILKLQNKCARPSLRH